MLSTAEATHQAALERAVETSRKELVTRANREIDRVRAEESSRHAAQIAELEAALAKSERSSAEVRAHLASLHHDLHRLIHPSSTGRPTESIDALLSQLTSSRYALEDRYKAQLGKLQAELAATQERLTQLQGVQATQATALADLRSSPAAKASQPLLESVVLANSAIDALLRDRGDAPDMVEKLAKSLRRLRGRSPGGSLSSDDIEALRFAEALVAARGGLPPVDSSSPAGAGGVSTGAAGYRTPPPGRGGAGRGSPRS